MAHGEIHLELSVDFADDAKLRRLVTHGRRARLARDLYVQMLCYCKRNMTDGYVPLEQVGLLVYPDSPKDGMQDVTALVEVGLVEVHDKDAYVPGFLKRNKSRQQLAEQAEAKRANGVLSNHRRWHDDRSDPKCPHCTERDAIGPPITPPIGNANRSPKRTESTESESESESESVQTSSVREDVEFNQFWDTYPRKVGKDAARKAWDKARRRERVPVIIAAVIAYRDDPNQPADKSYIPHPATWLNEGRWNDEPLPPRLQAVVGGLPVGTSPHDEWGFD